MALSKRDRRLRIKRRIKKIVTGTAEKPSLSVLRSNKEIYVQIINVEKGSLHARKLYAYFLRSRPREGPVSEKKCEKVTERRSCSASCLSLRPFLSFFPGLLLAQGLRVRLRVQQESQFSRREEEMEDNLQYGIEKWSTKSLV